MSVDALRRFLDLLADEPDVRWWLKRLSANDTQQTGGHQAGVYVPKDVIFNVLPELKRESEHNPREHLSATIESHNHTSTVQAIWYNNRLHGGTRNETRITGWGGRISPLLDPELTGAAALFAFGGTSDDRWCRVWVCETEDETNLAEERFGAIDPGHGLTFPPPRQELPVGGCGLSDADVPPEWIAAFPSPSDILERSWAMRPQFSDLVPDRRLLKRRDCEYELFQSVERAVWLPQVSTGFASLNAFLGVAQTILQRRRSRSGRSLEQQLLRIFAEEKLIESTHFDVRVETEVGHWPDFLFPSETVYHDNSFDRRKLRMLAVKTTLRERWRQVLEEADRISPKHLLTLQEGVSEAQFRQMREAGIVLVVPQPLQMHYPKSVRAELQSLDSFIAEAISLST